MTILKISEPIVPKLTLFSWGFFCCLFGIADSALGNSVYPIEVRPCNAGFDQATSIEHIQALISQLNHPDYQVRKSSFQQLQNLGYAAADLLLQASPNSDIETQQAIERLLQGLPSLHQVVISICSDCPDSVVNRLRDFQHQTLLQKVSTIRFLEQHSNRDICRLVLYSISRYESDPLIRRFSAAILLDNEFPIEASKAYSDPMISELLSSIPDRESPDSNQLVLLNNRNRIAGWIQGKAKLIPVDSNRYQLVTWEANESLTPEARMIRDCINAVKSSAFFPPQPVVEQIAAQTEEAVTFPVIANSPQQFDLAYESIVRLARWGMIQSQHNKQLQVPHRRLQDCLRCMGNDPDCFLPNCVLFCELAVANNEFEWLRGWHDNLGPSTIASNPTSTLAMSDAAFRLQQSELAQQWLNQDSIVFRTRFATLQYAILAKELGYSATHRYLLNEVAKLPLDGSPASVTAKLLNAEALAIECDYSAAANQLGWLLTSLQRESALAVRMEKLLPAGINGVRARYQYFLARDTASQWSWEVALRHLSVGNQLNPYDTNILTFAWELQNRFPSSTTSVSWNANAERFQFLMRTPVEGHSVYEGIRPQERFSDFQYVSNQNPSGSATVYEVLQQSGFNNVSVSPSLEIPALCGDYLKKQTALALDQFDQQIKECEFAVVGVSSRSNKHVKLHELSVHLNRWSYLAATTQIDSELAYLRAKRATELAGNKPAYFDTLAMCCERSGRLTEAIDATRMAVALAPHDSTFRTRLASLQILAQSELR